MLVKKEHHFWEKHYAWKPVTCSCKSGKYLANMIDTSVTSCHDIRETTKIVRTNFTKEKVTCKTKDFFFFLTFLLITITLLIAVSIYSYLTKYQVKQKHLLPITSKITD